MRPPLGGASMYRPIRPRPTDKDSDDPRNMVPLLMPRIPITRPLSLPSSSSVIVAVVPVVVRDDHPNEGDGNEDEEDDETESMEDKQDMMDFYDESDDDQDDEDTEENPIGSGLKSMDHTQPKTLE